MRFYLANRSAKKKYPKQDAGNHDEVQQYFISGKTFVFCPKAVIFLIVSFYLHWETKIGIILSFCLLIFVAIKSSIPVFKIAYHSRYCHQLPAGHRFPMIKYELIPIQLLHEGVIDRTALFSPEPATFETITLVHSETYLNQLVEMTLPSAMERRIGFPLSRQLVERELRIVQGTIEGCQFALEDGIAFNVAGGTHHAGSDWGEGFCLLNDQAVAAGFLLHHNLCKQILIVDLDVHQGNGTAEIFRNDNRVFTFSMHAGDNFPFRKEKSNLDVDLPTGTTDDTYLPLLNHHLQAIFDTVKPDFIFYQSGVDVLETDKLGKLKLSPAGCKARDELVFNQCRSAGVPIQVSMGGGYSPVLRHIVDAHCNTFKAAAYIYS